MIITKEQFKKASTYMPAKLKKELAEQISDACISSKKSGDKLIVLPEYAEENEALKIMLLTDAFLNFYIGIEQEDDGKDALDQYDEIAKDNIFNQVERFKADKETKDIAFDVLSDFKDFKKIVEVEIHNKINKENDILERLNKGLALFATPERVKEMLEYISKQAEELTKQIPKKEG